MDFEAAYGRKEKIGALARMRDFEVHADDDTTSPKHRPPPGRAMHGARLIVEVAPAGHGRDSDLGERRVEDSKVEPFMEGFDGDLVSGKERGNAKRWVFLVIVNELSQLDSTPLGSLVRYIG